MNAYQYNQLKAKEAEATAQGLSDMLFGKVQPQAIQLEEAVLGALMLDKDAYWAVSETLQPLSFYTEAHQAIYSAISELMKSAKPVDLLTVTEELRKMGAIETIGGSYHLVELTNRVGSSANIEYHARIIQQKHIARETIKAATRTISECYSESFDVFSVLESAAKSISAIEDMASGNATNDVDLVKAADNLIKMVEFAQNGGVLGVASGLAEVDKILNGSRAGRLELVAARPAMGKTGYMCQEIIAIAEQGIPVVAGSVEMTGEELLGRLATAKSGVENDKLEGKRQLTAEEKERWVSALRYITTLPIHINDSSNQSIRSLRALIRRVTKAHEMAHGKFTPTETRKCVIGKVWVDYLQIMDSEEDEKRLIREQQVAKIARGLKAIAKDFRVPVAALAQVNRAVEARGGNKIPTLADVRESGAVEQECDIISFLYRPEAYGIIEDEQGNSTANKMQFIVAKHRGGALGTANLHYNRETQKIQDWNDFYQAKTLVTTTHQNNIITGVRGTFREGADPDETETVPQIPINESDLPF